MPLRQFSLVRSLCFFFFVKLVLSSLAAYCSPAVADEPTSRSAFIASPSIALRTSPGGNLAGTLLRNVPVQVTEQKGRWAHVTVDGWIPAADLRENPSSNTALQSELAISGFRLEPVVKDKKQDVSKIRLLLQIRNGTVRPLSGWSAILAMREPGGRVVFRSPVEGGALEPGATGEFNFYWTEEEDSYRILSAYTSDNSQLTLELLTIKLK